MKYDFDRIVDRSGNYAAKYEERKKKFGTDDVMPLWVADMDFTTAQPVIDALVRRAEQGIYGYTYRPDSYFDAMCQWQEAHHNRIINKELLSFSPGVVPALSVLVRELTKEGDRVLIQPPVYPEFYDVVEAWGRTVVENRLQEEKGHYTVDFIDLEQKLAQERPALFILSNPHNPVGRVWSRDELVCMTDLCHRYGTLVVSDEIHSDLVLFGNRFTPTATVSEKAEAITITCISNTKTFNLAGLQASATLFPNLDLKSRFDSTWVGMDLLRNNCFSLVAVEAAYRCGGEWLRQLIPYLEGNLRYICDYCEENIPEIKPLLPESTYLLWLDCRGLGLHGNDLSEFMIHQAKLGLNDGRAFDRSLDGYMRLNAACPKAVLKQAMSQLHRAVTGLKQHTADR